MGVLDEINTLVSRRFRPIWEDCDREAAFKLCNEIREKTHSEPYSRDTFDKGWQYRTIFHEKYKVAKDEFVNLVFGWW